MSVPTILIGLGGIGSEIVNKVYQWIPVEKRERIVVHAFDTNVNDIQKWEHLKGKVTQTSAEWTVGQYLNMTDDSVKEWFIDPVPEDIKRKSLADGAGQIRMLSRLAYRAAIESGKLENIKQKIRELFRTHGEVEISNIRVMIVCSLSGGTGAGMFLQTALYLNDFLTRECHMNRVLIRGSFLLPDILIKSNTIDPTEIENVKTNAYACMKELDAITQNANFNNDINNVTIELEYKPNQTDAAGRQNYAITAEHLPYKFVFLCDFENSAGENIGSFNNYKHQVSKSIFLQLFAPTSNNLFSVEDNRILNLVEHQGRSRYCGSGVATLVYPYQDIVDYCALKWSAEGLSNHWLRLDEDYKKEIEAYEKDLNAGIFRERPKEGERYIWLLENYALSEKPEPFFKNIYRSTRTLGDKGEIGEAKAIFFMSAVEQEIDRILANDAGLKQAEADCMIDNVKLKIKEKTHSEVLRVEDSLISLKQKIEKAISEYRLFIVNQMVMQDCDIPGNKGGQDYRLNTWILGQPEPLHPVAVRHFLFSVQKELDFKIQALAPQNEALWKGIDRYQKLYDLPETEDLEESAIDRIKAALKQPFYKKLYKNHFKEFIEEYEDKAGMQLNALIRYKKDRLTEMVFQELREYVITMIEDWKRYFSNLRDTRNSLLNEINIRMSEHEGKNDPTQEYVLATKAIKEHLWNDIRLQRVGSELPADISRQIFIGQYRRFCKRLKGEHIYEEMSDKTEKMFRDDVVSWCRKEILKVDGINLNILRALRKEAELNNEENYEEYIINRVTKLSNLSKPFVPNVHNAQKRTYWGIQTSSVNELNEELQGRLFKESPTDTESLIIDEAFSEYEIICYKLQYSMVVSDFPKFSSGNEMQEVGAYFRSYKERIRQLTSIGNTITPHLDKRWHVSAYLPDLNPEEVKKNIERINRAFLLGLIYNRLKCVFEDGRDIWEFASEHGGNRLVLVNGRRVLGEPYLLHDALLHNPTIVDQIIDLTIKKTEQNRKKHPGGSNIKNHEFYKGCSQEIEKSSNIVDVLLNYPNGDPANDELPEKSYDLLIAVMDEIEKYFVVAYGSHNEITAKKEAALFIKYLLEKSKTYMTAEKKSSLFSNWENRISTKLNELTSEE